MTQRMVPRLILFHHAPDHGDDRVDKILRDCRLTC